MGRYDVKATFFLVGQWVDKYPESVKALSDAGHEIENHSSTHPHLPQCSSEQIRQELEDCNRKIEAITGTAPKFHRCPYGDYDNNAIRTIRSIGMEPIQWNVDSLDWKELTAPEITQRVMKNVIPGSIILFHNAAIHTPCPSWCIKGNTPSTTTGCSVPRGRKKIPNKKECSVPSYRQ